MPKFTAYFVQTTRPQTDSINRDGWGCNLGRAYLEARSGRYSGALDYNIIQRAATVVAVDTDQAYAILQNSGTAWPDKLYTECFTKEPRSLMVGDILVNEDTGIAQFVDSVGFGLIADSILAQLRKL